MVNILSVVGGVVGAAGGFLVGGPAGAVAGAQIGGKIGGAIDGKNAVDKGINTAVDTYTAGAQQGADILTNGYVDAALAKLDALGKVGALNQEQLDQTLDELGRGRTEFVDTMISNGEGYTKQMQDGGAAYRAAVTGAGGQFDTSLHDVMAKYGDTVNQLAGQLGVDLNTAAGLFKDGLEKSAATYGGELKDNAQIAQAAYASAAEEYGRSADKGLGAVTSALTPYATGHGTEALDYISGEMSADPTKLDPAQKLAREKFLRDSAARLASSGLRGAGRAGIAAVNSGDATLGADFFQQNRARSDAAAGTLASTGYGASTQIGAAGERAANNTGNVMLDARQRGISGVSSANTTAAAYGADARATGLQAVNSAADRSAVARQVAGNDAAAKNADAGKTVATEQLRLGENAAKNDQDVTQKLAGVNLNIGQDIANNGVTTSNNNIVANDRAHDQARTNATDAGNVTADAISGSATAQAGAVADPAYIAAQAALAKGQVKADTIGSIVSSASDALNLFKPTTSTVPGDSRSNV